MSKWTPAHLFQCNFCTNQGEIGDAKVSRTVVCITVLRCQRITLVLIIVIFNRSGTFKIAEAGVLIKMSPEGIAGVPGSLVAG